MKKDMNTRVFDAQPSGKMCASRHGRKNNRVRRVIHYAIRWTFFFLRPLDRVEILQPKQCSYHTPGNKYERLMEVPEHTERRNGLTWLSRMLKRLYALLMTRIPFRSCQEPPIVTPLLVGTPPVPISELPIMPVQAILQTEETVVFMAARRKQTGQTTAKIINLADKRMTPVSPTRLVATPSASRALQ